MASVYNVTPPWCINLTTTTLPPGGGDDHHDHGIHVVSWNFDYVAEPLIISIFVLVSAILKLAFHYAHFLSAHIPESCLLIVVGVAFGGIVYAADLMDYFQLTPRLFMLLLLPPIILDAAYSLNDRVFADNLGTILLYAVVGTLLNFFFIAPVMYGLSEAGAMGDIIIDNEPYRINYVECLLFSSFIVAVDPVAVLAIFQEIGVNNVLYFLVFGESLFNDAVTVVIYNVMKAFNDMETIGWGDIGLGVASFFTVSLGGLSIGLCFGVLTALLTRATSLVRVVEPLAVLVMAYLSFICAELFHWSGIISMIGCGLLQAQYSFHNISRKSYITVKYFGKMLSSTMDAIIFLFLGIELVTSTHHWHTGFTLWAIFYSLVFRFVVTFGLTFFANFARLYPIKYEEQFIMWYGGLRGAVCFALCETLRPDYKLKKMFLTTTLFVIMFTTFIQGITIKPLVKLFRIRLAEEKTDSVFLEIQGRVNDHMMAGVEVIAKTVGTNRMKGWFDRMNDTYFRNWLQNDPITTDQKIIAAYGKIAMKDYEANIHKEYMERKTMPQDVGSTFYVPKSKSAPEFPYKEPDMEDGLIQEAEVQTSPKFTLASIRRRMSRTPRESETTEHSSMASEVHEMFRRTRLPTLTIHQRHDRNLMTDDEQDLATQLREHHRRVERTHRMRGAVLRYLDDHKHAPSDDNIRRRPVTMATASPGLEEGGDINDNHEGKRSTVATMQSPTVDMTFEDVVRKATDQAKRTTMGGPAYGTSHEDVEMHQMDKPRSTHSTPSSQRHLVTFPDPPQHGHGDSNC